MVEVFHNMADILTEIEGERFALRKFQISEHEAKMAMIKSLMNGNSEYINIQSGEYIKLVDNSKFGDIVMSNTPMEQDTNRAFCSNANGDVLIGGLGIGMVVLAIQDKEDIRSITIIEKYQEVIDLVANQLPLNDKVKIINADIFDWTPPKGKKFDTIYFDIWNYINGDAWDEHKDLRRKYAKESTETILSIGLIVGEERTSED